MEYLKRIYLLDSKTNETSKFRTKNRVEINDDSHGVYITDNQIKLKPMTLKSNLCYYNDAIYFEMDLYNNY